MRGCRSGRRWLSPPAGCRALPCTVWDGAERRFRADWPCVFADILFVTSRGVETILVTGTNGKTTTAGMLAHAMEKAGRPVICNRAGANLLSGVTAEFAGAADLCGRPRGKQYAVIECDEGALHQAAPLVQPRVIVVTNLFRDHDSLWRGHAYTRSDPEGIRACPAQCSA